MTEPDIEFDITARLRKWAAVVPVPPAVAAMEDAAYEIEPLQCELTRACAAVRLTDNERQAIIDAIDCCEDITYGGPANPEAAATLRGLLASHDAT